MISQSPSSAGKGKYMVEAVVGKQVRAEPNTKVEARNPNPQFLSLIPIANP